MYTRKILEDDLPMSLICFYDTVYKMVPTSKQLFFKDIDKSEDKILLLVVIWTAHRELMRFLFMKTFHDEVFDQLNNRFERLNQVMINFADKNNFAFKNLLANTDFENDVTQTVIVKFSMNADRLLEQIEQVHLKRMNFLLMVERPETMSITVNIIRLMAEVCSGPNIPCQAAIYNYSLDKLTLPVQRVVDDVNSKFYQLKSESINYISAMTEELDYNRQNEQTVVDSMTNATRTVS